MTNVSIKTFVTHARMMSLVCTMFCLNHSSELLLVTIMAGPWRLSSWYPVSVQFAMQRRPGQQSRLNIPILPRAQVTESRLSSDHDSELSPENARVQAVPHHYPRWTHPWHLPSAGLPGGSVRCHHGDQIVRSVVFRRWGLAGVLWADQQAVWGLQGRPGLWPGGARAEGRGHDGGWDPRGRGQGRPLAWPGAGWVMSDSGCVIIYLLQGWVQSLSSFSTYWEWDSNCTKSGKENM